MLRAFTFVVTLLHVNRSALTKDVPIKIVEEPASFGYPYQQDTDSTASQLKMRVNPSNVSGPTQLKSLHGECFSKVDDIYTYKFCPFVNVTQHEQSFRWNPYNGVLGVWQEWEITNNTFTAMMFQEGDSCGTTFRSVRVLLQCGDENLIEKVSEPETCMYELVFKTQLVCHQHAMLVYPTLSDDLRHEWDIVESEYANDELTEKGYKKELDNRIFKVAGYKQTFIDKTSAKEHNGGKDSKTDNDGFHSLADCTEEYMKLKDEIEQLRTLIKFYQYSNNNTMHEKEFVRHNSTNDLLGVHPDEK